jgi:hypothetical protein
MQPAVDELTTESLALLGGLLAYTLSREVEDFKVGGFDDMPGRWRTLRARGVRSRSQDSHAVETAQGAGRCQSTNNSDLPKPVP